jgi:hypothetical protein
MRKYFQENCTGFWDVAGGNLVNGQQRFGGTWCPHLKFFHSEEGSRKLPDMLVYFYQIGEFYIC